MERAFYIENFRNIGLEKPERIVLNNSLEKGKMGNLVILIGPNNSGKTNVLDALFAFKNKEIDRRNLTTLFYEQKYLTPKLSLVVKDSNDEYRYEITYGKNTPDISYPEKTVQRDYTFMNDLDVFKSDLEIFKDYIRGFGVNTSIFEGVLEKLENTSNRDLTIIKVDTIAGMKTFFASFGDNVYCYHRSRSYEVRTIWNSFKHQYESNVIVKDFSYMEGDGSKESVLKQKYLEKYGMNFLPNIIQYKEEVITNDSIKCSVNYLSDNKFLTTLFGKIGLSTKDINLVYNNFNNGNNGALKTLSRDVNRKLEEISDDFNKLYFAESDKYSFEVIFESDKIYFSLFRGTRDIALDYQSTGFKWFFNLYFNLLCKTELRAGDIIIMDEPATNLHVYGRQELRQFLKEFAMRNDITIVMSTHDPFLVDMDYLDEIRVLSNNDNISQIHNDFSAINIDDPDSLLPIKQAFTVHNHVLYDPDSTVVFVEGITDYNYLLAFKKILKIDENIVFLPIKGVGNKKDSNFKKKQIEISKQLMKIKKHSPILIVDGDGAGKSIKQLNENDSELQVISLSDIDPTFVDIESLFAPADATNLNIKDSKGKSLKSSSNSSIIKTFYDSYKMSKKTIENFKKVFDKLLEN